MKSNSYSEVAALISEKDRILLVSHYNPDADAYGSSCGLAIALEALGKTVTVLNETGIVARFDFIPGVSKITATLASEKPDLVIVCDCGELSRVGDSLVAPLAALNVPMINIDHHATNDRFGLLNIVEEQASSTSELVYELLVEMKVAISADSATCLLSGISGDTGSFQYSSTSVKAFKAATALIECGADAYFVSQNLWGSRSLAALKLEAEVVQTLTLLADDTIACGLITAEMYERSGADTADADFIVGKIRDIAGVQIAVLFRRDGEIWRVNLRSKDPELDVSGVASNFGGGGHRAAAAFRSRREIDEIRPKVLEQLEEIVRRKV